MMSQEIETRGELVVTAACIVQRAQDMAKAASLHDDHAVRVEAIQITEHIAAVLRYIVAHEVEP